MPMAIPAAAAFFASVGTAVGAGIGAIGAAVGIATGSAVIGTAVASGLMTAAFAAPAIGLSMAISMATQPKVPKPQSTGVQVSIKSDPRSPIPIVFGDTAVGPTIVYRSAGGPKNVRFSMVGVTSIGPVEDALVDHFAEKHRLIFNADPQTGFRSVTSLDPPAGKLFVGNFRMAVGPGDLGGITPAPPVMTGIAMTGLDATSKLSGLAHMVYHWDYLQENFPGGPPNDLLVRMKGVWCYDPRKDSTYPGGSGAHVRGQPYSYSYSDNPYICALNWCLGFFHNGKKRVGIGAKWEEIDVGAFVNAANIADANGWKCAGQVTSADDKYAVLSTILQAGGGKPVTRGAQLSCVINAPKTTVTTITTNDVIGSAEIVTSSSMRDRKNTAIFHYREPSQFWNIIEGDEVTSATYVGEDDDETRTIEIEYPMVQSRAQAKQLATYDLVNGRELLTATLTCGPRLLEVRPGECVNVTLNEPGLANQKMLVVSRSFDPNTHQVTLSLRSETDAKHPFALGQTAVAPGSPSIGGGYDPTNPPAPVTNVWQIVATSITGPDGVSQPAIVIEGTADDPAASAVVVEYRKTGATEWTAYAEVPATHAVQRVEITGLEGGQSYEAAISYRMVTGIVGQRVILGPVTAGANLIPWDQVGGKPVDGDGNIDAAHVAWYNGFVRQTLQEAFEDVATAKQLNDAALAELTDADSLLNTAVESLWETVGTDDDEPGSLRARVGTLEEASSGEGSAIATRVTALETSVDDEETGLLSRMATVEQSTVDLGSGKADATRVTALEATVNTPTTGLSAKVATQATAISNLQTGKADASLVSTVQTTANSALSAASTASSNASLALSSTSGITSKALLQVSTSTGAVAAVQLNADGSTASSTSSIKLVAGSLAFVDSSGNGSVPFAVASGNVYVANNLYVGPSLKVKIEGSNNRIIISD